MPKKFKFYINNHLHFQSNLTSERCQFIKTNGQQCSRNTVIGLGLCFQHLEIEKHLRIKPSTIQHAGKGLFAMDKHALENDIIFRIGQNIVKYDGEIIDLDELNERFDEYTAPYTVYINNNRYDSAECHRGIGSLANHGNNQQANAKFNTGNRGNNASCRLQATKNIRNGDEIIVNYGRNYQFINPNTHYTTI